MDSAISSGLMRLVSVLGEAIVFDSVEVYAGTY